MGTPGKQPDHEVLRHAIEQVLIMDLTRRHSETPLDRWARAAVIVGGTVVALGLAVAWDVGLFLAVWKALFG